ncbi:MAG: hypothetical protein ACREE5_00525 [Acetobacteraceae bacterium]
MPKPATRPSKAAGEHPLVGAGLHRKGPDGDVVNQATVLAVMPSNNTSVGDLALIQYFDWILGDPSTRRLVSLVELASTDRWVLYSSVDEMKDHYDRVDAHQNKHIRAQEKE